MQIQTILYVERNEERIELHIFGYAERSIAACFNGHPDNWTPPEIGDVSVESVSLDKGGDESWDDELTDDELDEAESALMDALEDAIRDAEESVGEDKMEAMNDIALIEDRDYGDYGPDIYDF